MATKHGLIMSVPKEPGSDEYVAKSVNPTDVLDPHLMTELREMVRRGETTLDLFRRIQSHHGLAEDNWFWPAVYLVHTFAISIPTAKDIVSWCCEAKPHNSEKINLETMPLIMAQREKWGRIPETQAEPPQA